MRAPTSYAATVRSRPLLVILLALSVACAGALVGASATASIGTASLGAATSYPVQDMPTSVAVADLNGDTYADLAVTNSESLSVSILLGNATGGFGTATHVPTLSGAGRIPMSVAIRDLNGDAFRDLVVGVGGIGLASTVQVLLGTGTGTFGTATAFAAGNGAGNDPWAVVTGNFTGDDLPDIAVANKNTETVSVLAGDGAGGFAAPVAFPVGGQPSAIVAGDLNGDGRADLVTANRVTNDLSVLLANDSGSFAAATSVAVGNAPIALAVGDLGGTPALDLAVAHDGPGTVQVLLGDGSGAVSALPPVSTGAGAGAVAIGDLNNDSFPDVAVGNYFADTVSVLSGNGTGALGSKVDYPSEDPYAVAIGAFGSDALRDLAYVNEGTDDVTVRLSSNVTAPPNLGSLPASLTFGVQKVSTQSSSKQVMIVNNGAAGVPIDFTGVAGAALYDFPILSSDCDGVLLPPSAGCMVTVAFRPSATGARNAEVTVVTGDGGAIGVPISGTGVKARISKVAVSGPASAARGKVATYRVTVTNAGGVAATGVALAVSGKGIGAKLALGTIAAGKTVTAKVKVRPKSAGRIKTTFTVTSTDAGSRSVAKTITVT